MKSQWTGAWLTLTMVYAALTTFVAAPLTPATAWVAPQVHQEAVRNPGWRSMVKTSIYVGNDPAAVVAAEKWLGRSLDATQVFVGYASWSDWMGSMPWLADLFKGVDAKLLWSLPLIPSGANLSAAASGSYDEKYVRMAKQFVAASGSSSEIYVRVGWEFNASWFPWGAIGQADAYVGAYRHLVDAFRGVSDRFVFEWTPNIGGNGMDPAAAYPGDKYVDVIGMDFYYDKQWDSKDPNAAWGWFVTEKYGLQWHQDFAAAHSKPTAYAEWGINSDSAAFVKLAQTWFETHNVIYQNYWDSNAAFAGKLDSRNYPNAAAAFKAAFGVTSYIGTSDNDLLTGGTGANLFGLVAGGGHDTVKNFKAGDTILLQGFTPNCAIVISSSNTGVTLTAPDGSTLLLQGTTKDAVSGAIIGDHKIIDAASLTTERLGNQLAYKGDYVDSLAVTLDAKALGGASLVAALEGHNYSFTAASDLLMTGTQLTVYGSNLAIGDSLTFDGSSMLNGNLRTFGGNGDDHLSGGAGDDAFYFGPDKWGAGDVVHGGGGSDQIGLDGNYTITLDDRMDVELVALLGGPDTDQNHFDVKVSDAFIGNSAAKIVYATAVSTDLVVDASAVSAGALTIYGGTGSDNLTGGSGADTIFGNRGRDVMKGGAGHDTFLYDDPNQSTGASHDLILDFTVGEDLIKIRGHAVLSAAMIASGSLSAASFDADLARDLNLSLVSGSAAVYTATSGDLSGHSFLVVDANGQAGYQSGGDYVLEVTSAAAIAMAHAVVQLIVG